MSGPIRSKSHDIAQIVSTSGTSLRPNFAQVAFRRSGTMWRNRPSSRRCRPRDGYNTAQLSRNLARRPARVSATTGGQMPKFAVHQSSQSGARTAHSVRLAAASTKAQGQSDSQMGARTRRATAAAGAAYSGTKEAKASRHRVSSSVSESAEASSTSSRARPIPHYLGRILTIPGEF